MERVLERCCALDVHKRQVTACVHVPDQAGERAELRAEFGAMTGDLLGLRDWLKGLGVTHVAMEATGVYWKPVYYMLEDDFELWLVNAQHVKKCAGPQDRRAGRPMALPATRARVGACELRAAEGYPEPRVLTRYRKSPVRVHAREANRLQKLLEDANIKLQVACDAGVGQGDARGAL